ncbi:MAG: hypothetical protein IJJ33_17645 [Victivallales bacterium]|nr:hypothetical protein [Victivallales bacterium]
MNKGTILSCLALVAASAFAADFTDDFTSLDWSHWTGKGGIVGYRKNATDGCAAPGSAEMVFQEGHEPEVAGSFLRRVPVESGKSYRVTVKVRSGGEAGGCQASLGVQAFVGDTKFHSTLVKGLKRDVDVAWVSLGADFTVPDGVDKVQFLLNGYGPAKAKLLFDDFRMEEFSLADDFKDSFDTFSWGSWKAEGALMAFQHDMQGGRDGGGAALAQVLEGNPKGKSGCLTRHFPVEKGKEYTLLVFVKSEGLAPDARVSMSIQGQSVKPTKFLGTGVQGTRVKAEECREWRRMVFTYTIPTTGKWQDCGQVLVTLGTGGTTPGKVWFDDFEFFRSGEDK